MRENEGTSLVLVLLVLVLMLQLVRPLHVLLSQNLFPHCCACRGLSLKKGDRTCCELFLLLLLLMLLLLSLPLPLPLPLPLKGHSLVTSLRRASLLRNLVHTTRVRIPPTATDWGGGRRGGREGGTHRREQ